ncbi:LOW QUALITY PROTEIN: NPC intracellular cholesterol transporter 2 [Ascaphus truei]|uniref:LOW QUALITY PROTEIN: NPC intracellular cholesterol transporter 2 n=1 Tax=Ascaphus truei TaxID=8439 RepID=UPI003F59E65C
MMSLRELALLLSLTVALLSVAGFEPLVYKDCGGQKGKLLSVDVSPCPKQPCPLMRGSTYTINVTFSSGEDSTSSNALVYGILAGVPIPFHIPESDGCKSGISCPIKSGQMYTYITKMPIKQEYPCMKLVVRWKLQDEESNNLFCWDIPVHITDG